MTQKIRVGVLFGGQSAEHEVSLQSAKNVINGLDRNKYELTLIGIDKNGQWFLNEESSYLLNADNPKLIRLNQSDTAVALVPGKTGEQLVPLSHLAPLPTLDVVFPVLHGTYGEDGTIQGLLKLADVPFVGVDVLGAAVTMDKDVMKRLIREAGMPTADFFAFRQHQRQQIDYRQIIEKLGLPLFIKPANLGSSVGINKAKNETEFWAAIDTAFEFDDKIIVEEFIPGREIECAVLGNEHPIASLPGEVIPHHEFYSYDAKYIDEMGARLDFPANLPEAMVRHVQQLAVAACQVLCVEGMARVDFFLTADNRLYVNELNAIPGFTKISMYPKLWEVSGLTFPELLDRLIQLAIDRGQRIKRLKTVWM